MATSFKLLSIILSLTTLISGAPHHQKFQGDIDSQLILSGTEIGDKNVPDSDSYPSSLVSLAKRAPWAPTEIRYDAFIQKLLEGKTRMYGNRDKHSYGRDDDNGYSRSGRAVDSDGWALVDGRGKTGKLEAIYVKVKEIESELENLLSLERFDRDQWSSSDQVKIRRLGKRNSPSVTDDKPIEVMKEDKDDERNKPNNYYDSASVDIKDLLLEANRISSKSTRSIDASGGFSSANQPIEGATKPGSTIQLVGSPQKSFHQRHWYGRHSSGLSNRSISNEGRATARRRRNTGYGQSAIDSLLEPEMQEVLRDNEDEEGIQRDSRKSNNAMRFIG